MNRMSLRQIERLYPPIESANLLKNVCMLGTSHVDPIFKKTQGIECKTPNTEQRKKNKVLFS